MVFVFTTTQKPKQCLKCLQSLKSFKEPVILIAGGKDDEDLNFDPFAKEMMANSRVLVLVGECKERLNRAVRRT